MNNGPTIADQQHRLMRLLHKWRERRMKMLQAVIPGKPLALATAIEDLIADDLTYVQEAQGMIQLLALLDRDEREQAPMTKRLTRLRPPMPAKKVKLRRHDGKTQNGKPLALHNGKGINGENGHDHNGRDQNRDAANGQVMLARNGLLLKLNGRNKLHGKEKHNGHAAKTRT